MKNFIVVSIIFVIMVLSLASIIVYNLDRLESSVDDYRDKVGEMVVLKNDTLMVIDYSFVESNFILEDGREISIDLFESIHLKDE